MKKSEIVDLLALMAAFDRRTVGEADVEAWYLLDVCQRYDLNTCKAAVIKFFNQPPSERGESPYLDPHQLRAMVRQVRRDQEREENRRRAIDESNARLEAAKDARERRRVTDGRA